VTENTEKAKLIAGNLDWLCRRRKKILEEVGTKLIW
jgi:hypothetical protein